MLVPKIVCKHCNRLISNSNHSRHIISCERIEDPNAPKKILGIDFDPNRGYADGTRSAWNKGVKTGPNAKKAAQDRLIRQATDTTEFKSQAAIRKKVFEEQDFKCNSCGISEWMSQPLVYELEHIDGNNKNNIRTNLECLCPNCHSLTKTWRGRNNKKISTTTQQVKGLN